MYKSLDRLVEERCRTKHPLGSKRKLAKAVRGMERLDNRSAFGLGPAMVDKSKSLERQYSQLTHTTQYPVQADMIITEVVEAVPRRAPVKAEAEVMDVETQAQPEVRSMRTQARGLDRPTPSPFGEEEIVFMESEDISSRYAKERSRALQQDRMEYSLERANRDYEAGASTERELETLSLKVEKTPRQERSAREMARVRRELDFAYENLGLAEEKRIEDNIKSLSRRSKAEIVSKYKRLYEQIPEEQKASFVPPSTMEVRVSGGFDKPRALGEIKRALQLLGYVDDEFDLVKDYIDEPERALETAGEVEAVLEDLVEELEVEGVVDEMLEEITV